MTADPLQFIRLAPGEVRVLAGDLDFRQSAQRRPRHNEVNVLGVATFNVLEQRDAADHTLARPRCGCSLRYTGWNSFAENKIDDGQSQDFET